MVGIRFVLFLLFFPSLPPVFFLCHLLVASAVADTTTIRSTETKPKFKLCPPLALLHFLSWAICVPIARRDRWETGEENWDFRAVGRVVRSCLFFSLSFFFLLMVADGLIWCWG